MATPLDAAPSAPTGPLTEPFSVGLGPLLTAVGQSAGGALCGSRARRVIDAIGDRYTVTVSPDGVGTRGMVRTRHLPWERAEAVELDLVTTVAARRVAARGAGKLVRIPGLRWLVTAVLAQLGGWLAGAAANAVDHDLPKAVLGVTAEDGDGIQLEGPLALVSVLSRELTRVIVAEASRRDVPVRDV